MEETYTFNKEQVELYLQRTLDDVEWQAIADWLCNNFEMYLKLDLDSIRDTPAFDGVIENWKELQ